MRKLCVFDIEVLKNAFICCCRVMGGEYRTFEISSRRFELQEMYDFFVKSGHMFVGYNSSGYDSPIMQMIFKRMRELSIAQYDTVCRAAYDLSAEIINSHDPFLPFRYNFKLFESIDLMTMMASKALRVGLKSLQVTMCYPNVQEMVIDWKKDFKTEDLDELIHYCHNDIDSTAALLHLLKDDLKLRMAIKKEYKIDCLSKDGVGIGVDIFTKYICEELGLANGKELMTLRDNLSSIPIKDFILPEIKFKTKAFQNVLNEYNAMTLDANGFAPVKEWSVSARCNNLIHTFGLGGLHSVNKPKVFEEDDDYVLIDADVGSMYPSMALAWLFGPKGFREAFLRVMIRIKTERMEAKRAGNKVKDKTMKLSLNSILGNLRNAYSAYFAPEANTAICVNGQLFLAMLIEDLELAGIEVIMSNTDGITSKIHKSKLDEYYAICKKWEELSKIELEFVKYEKMAIYAVNDYVAYKEGYKAASAKMEFPAATDWIEYNYAFVKIDDKGALIDKYIKAKGLFLPYTRLGKGLDSLIISKALIDYFGKGIPIKQTIENPTSIWDFISFQKIGKQYRVLWNGEEQQHINRFYISKKGAYLYKEKTTQKYDKKSGRTDDVKSLSNVLKGYGVQIMNVFEDKPMDEYDIQYSYYIHRANEIVNALEPMQQTLF